MDVIETIKCRRSIRKFKKEDIPKEKIYEMLTLATYAPSAGNLQSWEFILVRDHNRKIAIAESAFNQKFIAEAPWVIVVCANQSRSSRYYGRRGMELYSIQDTAAAIYVMLLYITANKLGACWVGAFDETKLRDIIKTPTGVKPVAIIPVGVPDETPSMPQRYPIDKIVHYETF